MNPARLQVVLARLVSTGIVISTGPIKTKKLGRGKIEVEVGETSAVDDFGDYAENSIHHFSQIVGEGRYSLMFCDGSICQIKYILRQDAISWHRFAYYPCLQPGLPILSPDEIEYAAVIEGEMLKYPRSGMLRFEYDPEAASASHPASHLHLVSPKCRIALKASLGLGAFLDFVILHFYSDFDRAITHDFRSDFGQTVTITQAEKAEIHLSWIDAA